MPCYIKHEIKPDKLIVCLDSIGGKVSSDCGHLLIREMGAVVGLAAQEGIEWLDIETLQTWQAVSPTPPLLLL